MNFANVIVLIAPECVVEPISETCTWRNEYDPETLAPLGPACGAPATHLIHGRDGRISSACGKHGLDALDDDARALVDAFEPIE